MSSVQMHIIESANGKSQHVYLSHENLLRQRVYLLDEGGQPVDILAEIDPRRGTSDLQVSLALRYLAERLARCIERAKRQ